MATLINLWMRFWTAFGSGSQHQSRASYCRYHNRRLLLSFIPMPARAATLLLVTLVSRHFRFAAERVSVTVEESHDGRVAWGRV
jgi:hypothetical protein